MSSVHSQHFPSGGDIHHWLSAQIADAIQSQLQNSNSPLYSRLQGKTFQNTVLVQLAIQDAFRDIWQSGVDQSAQFGFLGNPDSLEASRYSVHTELWELARNVFDLIQPAIIDNSGVFTVEFDNASVEKIITRLERETKWVKNAAHLLAWESNQTEKIAIDRVVAMLKQAPTRLRAELKNAWYPAKVKYDQFKEWKVFKAIETVILSSAFGFMTYGWHGLTYNGIDYLARGARNTGDKWGIAETIITDSLYMNSTTWWAGLLAATLIGLGIIKWASIRRKYLIRDAEESAKIWKSVKVWSSLQRNWLFAWSIMLALAGAVFEAGGILAHEVQWIYTAQKAYEVGKAVDKLLDLQDTSSPAGKVHSQYQVAPATIDAQATNWYNAELKRPGASGVWPAALAKQYLKDGNPVLQNPILARDPNLSNIVQSTEGALIELSPKSHAGNYTFKLKAEAVWWAYQSDVEKLRSLAYGPVKYTDIEGKKTQIWGLYKGVYEKGWSAKTPDFLHAKDAFEEALAEFEKNQVARTAKWSQITAVYQDYINRTSAAADAKYRSNTTFDAKIQFDTPDLSDLKKKVAEVPKLEWKTAIEYWDELNKLTWVEGGISQTERAGIITLIALRSGVIEWLAGLMLFLGLGRVRKYYGRPKNLLSEKEKTLLHGYYENMVQWIQKAFSGPNWNAIFPDDTWLSRDEAEYLARKLITKIDPTLIEWFPVHKEWIADIKQHVGKIAKKTVGLYKDILTGNTYTSEERKLSKLNAVLEKLSIAAEKDQTGLGIPLSVIAEVLGDILPSAKITGKIPQIATQFDAIVSEIASRRDTLRSLSGQTVEGGAIQNEVTLMLQLEDINKWIDWDMAIMKNQIENLMKESGVALSVLSSYTDIHTQMTALAQDVRDCSDPSFSELNKWNRAKISIEQAMK